MEEEAATLNAKDELLERTNSLNLEILKIERPSLLGEEPETISLEDLNVEYDEVGGSIDYTIVYCIDKKTLEPV